MDAERHLKGGAVRTKIVYMTVTHRKAFEKQESELGFDSKYEGYCGYHSRLSMRCCFACTK